jgi:hypothetical protein
MSTDALLLLWVAIFVLPTAVAFARGRRLRWWLLANLLIGWHPTLWITLLALAGRRT